MFIHQDRQATTSNSNEEDRCEVTRPNLGRSIIRAILSPDGMYVAAITTQSEILISRCASEYSSVVHYSIRVSSKQVQKVLAHAEIFRWSPEVYTVTNDSTYQNAEAGAVNHLRAWLLVSDRQHLTALSIELDLLGGSEAVCTIIANYDLGTVLGRLSYADFCFSHQYAIVLQTTGIQATLISLTRPERHDIPNTKYQDKQGLAVSQNSKYFAILMRSEGQDIIHVFTTTEMGSIKSSPFSPWTYDAQGLKWCPNGDPLLCVWDSATFGSKVSFLTASGHHLRQLDLPPNGTGLDSISAGFQGLGVNTVDWLSFDGKAVLGVFNSSRQLYLWGQSGSQKIHSPMVTLHHQDIVDGTAYPLWQESQDGKHHFTRHSSAFEPHNVSMLAGADQIGMNANGQLLATKESSRPWTLWLWNVS